MPASDVQIAANRANAQHSTGPLTTLGKEKSSRNSRGPIARFLVMTNEDESKLEEMIEDYRATLEPANPIEEDLVVEMVTARWRRNRLLEFEATLLSSTIDKVQNELGPDATRVQVSALALERLIDGSKTWATLQRYLRDAERTFNTCLKQLTENRTVPQRKNEPNIAQPRPQPEPQPEVPSRFGKNVPLRPNGYPVDLALAL